MTTTAHPHEPWCLPRPGEKEPRIESYRAQKTGPDGSPAGSVAVRRCQECAVSLYDGVRRG